MGGSAGVGFTEPASPPAHASQRTAICVFSARARDGAPIAVPLAWDELFPNLKPDHFTIETTLRRLKTLSLDPWKRFDTLKQLLPKVEKKKARA
jgi:bifunctional non-homologous end joining protein LigD